VTSFFAFWINDHDSPVPLWEFGSRNKKPAAAGLRHQIDFFITLACASY
jgi:hypothetical protein